jgi:hypothetical protein
MSYSERAQKAYQNAELDVIKGGGHEFFGDAFDQACVRMAYFFQQHGLIKAEHNNQ